MKLLACDVGLKRIGLAIYKAGIAFPLEPIIRFNRHQAASDLDKILCEYEIEQLIVGLPSGGESGHTEMMQRIKHFVGLLTFKGGICFINEDYSSIEALESLAYMKRENRAKAQKDGRIDSLSACIILERYIQSIKC